MKNLKSIEQNSGNSVYSHQKEKTTSAGSPILDSRLFLKTGKVIKIDDELIILNTDHCYVKLLLTRYPESPNIEVFAESRCRSVKNYIP